MKSKKLLLILFLFVFILCSCQTTPIDEFDIELEDGNATISGYHGSSLDIIIPSHTENRQIKKIGKKAFKDYDLKTLTISEGITTIGKSAFSNCKQLESVKLPNTLETISDDAFINCDSLKEIHIPENVKNISEHSIGYELTWTDDYYSNSYYKDTDKNKDFPSSIKIYGKSGSTAEEYAKKNDFTFISE